MERSYEGWLVKEYLDEDGWKHGRYSTNFMLVFDRDLVLRSTGRQNGGQ